MSTSTPDLSHELLAASWPPELRNLSATSIKSWLMCPERFRQEKILREPYRPNVSMVWGSAHHKAVEVNLRQKIDTGVDLSTTEVCDRFITAVEDEVEARGGASSIDWTMAKKEVRADDVKRRGLDAVTAYHEGPTKLIQPVAAERRFTTTIPGVPVPIIGYIDAETERGAIDLKLSGRAKTKLDPEWALQGGLYAREVRKRVSFHLVTFDGRLHMPDDDEQHGRLPFTVGYSLAGVAAIEDLVVQVANGIAHAYATYGPDDPWPGAITHPWACGYCSVSGDCRWYQSIVLGA